MARATGILAALLVTAACGSGGGIEYDGVPGRPEPAYFDSWVPSIDVSIDGDGPHRFLLDTGSPLTFLDTDSFAGDDGARDIDLDAFQLQFPGYPSDAYDVFPFTHNDYVHFDGIVGGDLMSEFTFSLDYQNQRVWLDDDWDGQLPDGVVADSVDAGQIVDAPVEGGGVAILPGDCDPNCGTRKVPATRVLVEVELEDLADPVWMLVDTGSSSVVLPQALIDQLDTPGRPRLDGVTVRTVQGVVAAYFTRVWRMSLGGTVSETSMPALVMTDSSFLDSVSAEVGLDVKGLIGGTFLRHYLCTIDYPVDQMVMARYVDQGHTGADEFVGVGFTMGRYDGTWTVLDVYPGTSAASAGIVSGDAVVEIDGNAITGADRETVDLLLAGFGLGDTVPVGVTRGGGTETLSIEVEDLLPAFEEP